MPKKRKSECINPDRPEKQSRRIDSYFSIQPRARLDFKGRKDLSGPLSDEQKRVLDMVVEKRESVFFTGAAGTGKSFLLQTVIAGLREEYVKHPGAVSVTASTGMAASLIGGTTIHSWGAVSPNSTDLDNMIKCIRKCKPALNRWKNTKVLIIDEISMVDGRFFGTLSSIAQRLRDNTLPFGGIQLVITGDFFQLPPVTTPGTDPFFAFQNPEWKKSIQHTVTLTRVFRQRDSGFADMLNSLRKGGASRVAIETFTRLHRPLTTPDGIVPTELFPLKCDVLNANMKKLGAIASDSQLYHSRDSGKETKEARERILNSMAAEKTLEIKVDAQVMLIKNVDESLVNGSVGLVLGFYTPSEVVGSGGKITPKAGSGFIRGAKVKAQDGDVSESESSNAAVEVRASPQGSAERFPLVEFWTPSGKEVVLVGRDDFKVENSNGTVVARRVQIPLVLAWAMSIHKSQGRTIQYVKVDLAKVFENGQTYVALSRASSLDGLQVLHFDSTKVRAHKKVVEWFQELQMRAEEEARAT